MGEILILVMVALIAIAALTRETFVLVLGYLLLGTYLLGRWWSNQSLKNIRVRRIFNDHVFPGESVPVRIELANKSWLPAIWLGIRDLHPVDLSEIKAYKHVISLPSRKTLELNYELKATRRGYYAVGPMSVETGDIFGWVDQALSEFHPDYLTVYPRIIPLKRPDLPSHSPLGTLRHKQPIFEDPTRTVGKRDYVRGDALKRVDWKSSASIGRLQVKLFEPSIDMEMAIFLNLNTEEYHAKARFDGPELSIVTAASLASWAVKNRQSVGLVTNGIDPLNKTSSIQPLQPRKTQAHLMRLLESLARVKSQANQRPGIREMLRNYRQTLSWGATLIVVTGSADESLFKELILARQAGLKPILIVCGWYVDVSLPIQNGKAFGIPISILHTEEELRGWQL
jgi:uncharacterized protein (DUF58 family)